jgi:hypothetical protein
VIRPHALAGAVRHPAHRRPAPLCRRAASFALSPPPATGDTAVAQCGGDLRNALVRDRHPPGRTLVPCTQRPATADSAPFCALRFLRHCRNTTLRRRYHIIRSDALPRRDEERHGQRFGCMDQACIACRTSPKAAEGFGRCSERVDDEMVEWPSRRTGLPTQDTEASNV